MGQAQSTRRRARHDMPSPTMPISSSAVSVSTNIKSFTSSISDQASSNPSQGSRRTLFGFRRRAASEIGLNAHASPRSYTGKGGVLSVAPWGQENWGVRSHSGGGHSKSNDGGGRLTISANELDRMDRDHYAWQLFFGANYCAPISHPNIVLDIGTGSGLWILEMASQLPYSQLIGVDLQPRAPTLVIPPNCQFIEMNILKGLEFPETTVDYIHHRNVSMIPIDYWPTYLMDCSRLLKPGGWLEVMETDCILRNAGPNGDQFNRLLRQGLLTHGVRPRALKYIAGWMTVEAELDEVATRAFEVPLFPGEFNGDMDPSYSGSGNGHRCTQREGGMRWDSFYPMMLSFHPTIKATCEIEFQEWRELLDRVAVEAETLGTFVLHIVIYGRKPHSRRS